MTKTATQVGQGVISAVAKWACPEWRGPRLGRAWLGYFLHVQRRIAKVPSRRRRQRLQDVVRCRMRFSELLGAGRLMVISSSMLLFHPFPLFVLRSLCI